MTVATSDHTTEVAVPAVSATIARYAADLGSCLDFASRIVNTPIVPASFWPPVVIPDRNGDMGALKAWEWDVRTRHPKESPEQFAARRDVATATTGGTILLGADLDLPWSAAITGIYFVGGRPSLMTEQMRALVLVHGHYFRTVERTPERCVVEVKRKSDPGEPIRYEFTIEQAVRAGYVKGKGPNANGKGGNDKYNSAPDTMLYARATSVACKAEFPDVIRGMAVAELADDEPVDVTATTTVTRVSAEDIAAAAPQAITVSVSGKVTSGEDLAEALRRSVTRDTPTATPAAASPAARAPQEPEVVAEVGPVATSPDVPMCTDAQYRRINAWFKASGIDHVNGEGQAAARTRVVNMLVADPPTRPLIAKWSEMTEAEAKLVIDTLDANGFAIVAEAFEPVEQQPAEASSDVANHEQADAEPDLEPDADDPWRGQGGE